MIILLFLIGLIFGSFIGALSYRLPLDIPISKGRSFCPNCKHQISWYDNIPLFSYLFLLGRCRNCKQKISMRYPLIELATGIIFAALGLNIINLILAGILLTIFITDLEHQLIFDELVFIALTVLVFGFLISSYPLLFENLLAGLLSGAILLFLNIITKGKGMGLGDVKLAILIGAIIGLNLLLVWLFFSFVIGAIIGIVLIIVKKAKMREAIPFGPFLIIGLVLTNYFGNYFLRLLNL